MTDPRNIYLDRCARTAEVADVLAAELTALGLHDEAHMANVIAELVTLRGLDTLGDGPIVEHNGCSV